MSYQILLVDDDDDFRDEFCEAFSHYRIIEASCAEQTLAILQKPNTIDLVILDVMLPGLKGTEILKDIKKIAPDLGIIILTGQGSKEVAVEALQGRADDYIEKPFDVLKVEEIIQRVLKQNIQKAAHFQEGIIGKIERTKYFIERNYDKKVSLKEAAKEVCLSPKYLSRVFKQHTKEGFNDYRIKLRMQKAKELLKQTHCSINEMAYQLGYENVESFIRLFKKTTQSTPTEYREKTNGKKHNNPH